MVCSRARKYGFVGKKITLTVRYSDFETFTKQAALQVHRNSTHEIYHYASDILDSIRLVDKVRLIGVSLSQLNLFNAGARMKSMLQAVDSLNDKFGDSTITWAAYLKTTEAPSVISPVWKPTGIRNTNIKN
jgi:DNA polymerase-4